MTKPSVMGGDNVNYEMVFQELLTLNRYEHEGKYWYLSHGENISYTHFLPSHRRYDADMLRDDDFFQAGKSLEVEKALRYVDIPQHRHEFVEFIYLAKGPCSQRIDQNIHEHISGDFIVIPPGTSHALFVPEDSLCLTMKIRRETFVSLRVPNMALFVLPLLFPCKEDAFVLHTMLSMYDQQERNLPYCDEIMIHLFVGLMAYLMQNYRDIIRPLNMDTISNYNTLQMVNFIFENYRSVTLQSLAEEFHYSKSYLSTQIRKGTGKTFTENLREFRMIRAEEILRTSPNVKLAAVCEEIGYGDTVKFIRDFKAKYGVTPAKYKRKFQK